MQLHQPLGERQAQAGALKLAIELAVDLAERRQRRRNVFGRDADTAVAHLDHHTACGIGAHLDGDAVAGGRELHRVR